VAARGSLTTRAVAWAIAQLRTQHASVQGLARLLQVAWKTLWRAIKPHLEDRAEDEARFAGVSTLGVDDSPARCAPSGRCPQCVAPHPAQGRDQGAVGCVKLIWPQGDGADSSSRRNTGDVMVGDATRLVSG
jgi:hypothetical protein